jgi:hypothetical protein
LCAASIGIGPSTASAQGNPPAGRGLTLPTIAASAAAAADWSSTYHALTYYRVREVNPLLGPFQRSPARLVSVGALMDAGAVSAWNLALGATHRRVAVSGLWAMTALRTYLAVHNIRNEKKSARR